MPRKVEKNKIKPKIKNSYRLVSSLKSGLSLFKFPDFCLCSLIAS